MKKMSFVLLSAALLMFASCSNKEKELRELNETQANISAEKALSYGYGVAVGTLTSNYLEPAANEGQWTHYVANLNVNGSPYECVINMFQRSADLDPEDFMSYRIVRIPASAESYFNQITSKTPGYYSLAANSTSGALDFIRHEGVLRAINSVPWTSAQAIANETEIPEFDAFFANTLQVFALGEPYHYGGNGVHCIHQNQGNLNSQFDYMNGRWQDGGVIVKKREIVSFRKVWFPSLNRYLYMPIFGNVYYLLMTRFAIQKDFTNTSGTGVNPNGTVYSGSCISGNYVQYGPFSGQQKQFELYNCTGNPDLYIRSAAYPTTTTFDYVSSNTTGAEFIRLYNTSSYYVRVYANGANSSWSFKVSTANFQ